VDFLGLDGVQQGSVHLWLDRDDISVDQVSGDAWHKHQLPECNQMAIEDCGVEQRERAQGQFAIKRSIFRSDFRFIARAAPGVASHGGGTGRGLENVFK
jgi:hypothetical protein